MEWWLRSLECFSTAVACGRVASFVVAVPSNSMLVGFFRSFGLLAQFSFTSAVFSALCTTIETANREDSWSLLRHLRTQFDLPWVCIGDFNEITRLEEKSGGALKSDKQMQVFRDCLDFCGFKDIGFTGLPFTWCNNRFNGPLVWVRLDRAIASAEWMLKFPSIRLHHLAGFYSDHKPIWLCTDDVHNRFYQHQRPFHFEEMWIKDKGCEGVVHVA
ncbi:hypothetical protein SO802_012085 [Lithocarpus litseifolius]|uniref:Exo_endo_phos domain-containing protein n=1 Tax=Lithocarpus litseifolius TaxID=425828 RepID=A0AAW2D4F0_9ROSI